MTGLSSSVGKGARGCAGRGGNGTRAHHSVDYKNSTQLQRTGLQVLNRSNPTIPYQGEAPNNCKLTTEFQIHKKTVFAESYKRYLDFKNSEVNF